MLKIKYLLDKFIFIDHDSCLNSDMFCLNKLHLVGNLALGKSICKSMEYSHKIKTRNSCKNSRLN